MKNAEKKLTINQAEAWLMGIDLVATGKQLSSKRREFHLTREGLSHLFEDGGDSASVQAIYTWESGKRLPSLVHVVFLAELYDCTIDELVLTFRRSRENEEERDELVPFYFSSFTSKILFIVNNRFLFHFFNSVNI